MIIISLLHSAWITTCELAPWLLLGTIISAVLHVVFSDTLMSNGMSGYRGILKGVVFGVPLPLCSCGVIPTGIGLKKTVPVMDPQSVF